MATKINNTLDDPDLVVLPVLLGGMVFCSELLKHLNGNPQLGYLHTSRYQQQEVGGTFKLIASAYPDLIDRQILIADDILDQGNTLSQLIAHLENHHPARIFKAVMTQKKIPEAPATRADFVGLTVPNQYVFGYGMDFRGRYRHLPAIYTLSDG